MAETLQRIEFPGGCSNRYLFCRGADTHQLYPVFLHSLDPEGFVLIDPLMQLTLLIQQPKIAAKPGFYCGGICCMGSWYNPIRRIAVEKPPELRHVRLFWADTSSV